MAASLGAFQEALLLCKSISLLGDTVAAEQMGMTPEDATPTHRKPTTFDRGGIPRLG
ncbi:MAG: hypothetical protein KA801_02185 [Syntrophorhabdaceae bacterium]|nr:hypothetical protein [Syntrophorhabdaceae bacterium]